MVVKKKLNVSVNRVFSQLHSTIALATCCLLMASEGALACDGTLNPPATTTIGNGDTRTTECTIYGAHTLTVDSGGAVNVSGQSAVVIDTASTVVIDNSGMIQANNYGIYALQFTGSTYSITNRAGATIQGASESIRNLGSTITGLVNDGDIGSSGSSTGILNSNTGGTGIITSIVNNEPGKITGSQYGINNGATITSLVNFGEISGGAGIRNGGTITTLSNTGLIDGTNEGVWNRNTGTIDTFTNSGTIKASGAGAAIINQGTITNGIVNTGTLEGGVTLGGASLYLNGNSSRVTGPVIGVIAGSQIFVNGQFTSENTFDQLEHFEIANSATFTMANDVGLTHGARNFANNGTLAVNDGVTIFGNYIQDSAATLRVNVTDDTTYGRLRVGDNATLPSNAKIDVNVANPDFSFTATSLANIIEVDGTLTSDGTFTVTDNSLLFNFDAVKDGNTVDLTLSSASSSSSGGATTTAVINTGSPASLGAATIIDNVIANNPTGELSSNFVNLTTEEEVANAVESTLPGVSGGVSQMTNIATNAVTGVVAARQDLTRGLSSGDGFMTDRHIWFKPFGGWTEQDDRQGVTGYDIDSYGLAAGFDGDVSSTWNVGFALAYINSDVESNLASGSHTIDMDSYMAKVYATKMFDDVTALNLQVGAGISDYDSNRRIFTGDVANADYDSWNVQLSAELERSYQISEKTVMTPYIHADYGYVDVEDYSESGAGALNLNVAGDSSDSLIIGAGVKGNHSVSVSLLLMANAGVGYDVMADRSSLTSSFAGGGAQFTTEGIEPDEWVYNAGVGAKYSLDNGTEITASYNIDARQGYTNQSVSANFRLMF